MISKKLPLWMTTLRSFYTELKLPLWLLGLSAFTSTLLFWFTDVDIWASAWFFNPDSAENAWPYAHYSLWHLFYYGAPLLAGLLAVFTVVILLLGVFNSHFRAWQRPALFILLTLALGPGLLVNFIFKDHWGRPRPWQITEFQGYQSYLPPLKLGISPQYKSFPSGHAALGFSFCVLWLLWRHSRPQWALASLLGSLLLGLLMGLARIATGAHFLSDVLWAGYLTFFTAMAVYYFLLPSPSRIIMTTPPVLLGKSVFYATLGFIILLGAFINMPIETTREYQTPPLVIPETVRVELNQAELLLNVDDHNPTAFQSQAHIHGFGLPNYRVDQRVEWEADTRTLIYRLKPRGFFTELHIRLDMTIGAVQRVIVRVQSGDIHVTLKTPESKPNLDVHTDQGRVFPVMHMSQPPAQIP